MLTLRDTLTSQGYTGVEGALYYQIAKKVKYRGQLRTIKIDLLAPLPTAPEELKKLKISDRRVRLRNIKKIHAHPSPEASIITDNAVEVELYGCENRVLIMVPHPFVFASLKLHVYRDRHDDEEKDFARHHAFDLYRLLAMMTEREWEEALALRERHNKEETVVDARGVVKDYFHSEDATGILALREHAKTIQYEISRKQLRSFVDDLTELYPEPNLV